MVITAQNINPKPRYKQTEVGMIPEDWEPTPLGLLSAFITKGATPTTYGFSWANDGILFLRSECVSEQGLDLTQSMFITPEAHNILKRGEVRAGDILITITGNVGRVIYLSNDFGIANINQHIARIRIIDINVAADYVFHFLSQSTIRKYYGSITTGQAYPQISLKQVRDTRVPIPPTKAEQTAIASALSDIDALIASLDRLIVKRRDIKQATMQQLLTGKTRLPGFSDEWEVRKLGEILRVRHGKSQQGVAVNDGKYPILGTGGEIGRTNDCIYDKPSVLIGRKGTIDSPQYMDTPFWTIDTLFYTEISGCVHPRFVFYLFNMIAWLRYNEASGVPSLNASTIENIEIRCPLFLEQRAIADILTDIDAEIAALVQKRDKTRALKQGMMQELLTGKTRLV
jgi:type I restriction enzyme, S subunit